MYEFLYYRVKDVMTSDPTVVRQDVILSEVEVIFEENDFNGLPVVGKSNELIGMITKLDLLKAFDFTKKSKVPHYDAVMAQRVLEVMTKELHVMYPDTPITRVLQQMIETGHKSLPVIEDDHVVGIVAREDVMRALARAAEGQLPARLGSSTIQEPLENSNI
ncbi:MAG: CBS domain-containing protein [Desulfobacteraceae bacterium]|jgi:CBS domain-containing protein